MIGPIGLKGSSAAAVLARQRMTAMSRSSRSMSTLRSQSLRFPSQRGQLKSAISGSAPWRMTPTVTGPAAVRFNSTSSDSTLPEFAFDGSLKNAVNINDITTIPERIGYLKELGLDFGWGFTSTMQWLIEHTHIWTGLPWWASIVAVGVLTRVAMLKPVLGASENAARMTNAKSQTEPLRQKMVAASTEGNQQEAQIVRAQLQEINAAHGIKTWKSILPMLQIPLGFGCFRVVRAMTALPVPALATETAGWIKDLTIADPTYILPMIAAGTLCLSLRRGGESGAMPMMQTEAGKYIIYGFPVMSFAFMAFMPSALQFYFVASGLFGLGQTYLINSDAFRKWMSLSIAKKPSNGPKFSAVTQSTQSKGLRQLLERLEKEKAAQEKALSEVPVSSAQEDVKISIIDRIYQKFGKVGSNLSKSVSETMGTSTVEQRIAKDQKKRADEYEQQRKDEDELMRRERNEARRKEHMQTLENERTKASKSLKNSQTAARKPNGRRGSRHA
ncbi:Mitochondrial export translocase Oxa1, putative [Penicillium digitatum]|uniref:Mitochondrial export translocase Oxa1, putative n=3 Tax=Penicillium digitatum TaxID=36651 RepID=K9GNE5_PEND2|nr:Mitochondrial export translocase Oxa1, putative [Penicillium digitatum Pd1]EKV12937.1 Mitochondrial export translocase Oxa1, putative [Penicillium digitatum Pd1]EKV14711.1 Mitochondrial export translocase Oxa1, putative [Penicillium digitatum PHI26]QQK43321.1 Mitochondrial export translocase Oxa1, putative [Penicillium digitatum]